MIASRTSGAQALALLQARSAKPRSATVTPANAKEGEAAKAAEEKRQRTDELLRMLSQRKSDVARERKAAAAQKVERLKRELELLRLFSGDPKSIARQAARIARDLGAAAQDYSRASGGADLGAPTPSAPAGEATAAAEQPGAQDAGTGEGAEARPGDSEQNGDTKPGSTALSPEEERAKLMGRINQAVGEAERRAGEATADQKFVSDIRNLFAQVKALLEEQRRRAAAENRDDHEFDQFAKDVADAGAAIEQASVGEGMEPGIVVALSPVNITV